MAAVRNQTARPLYHPIHALAASGALESFSVSKEEYRGESADAMAHVKYLPFKIHVDSQTSSGSGITNKYPVTETIATWPASHNVSLSSPIYCKNSNVGLLEQMGRWLMSIPHDDVVALQNTLEYKDFFIAFDGLGEAHRCTVMLEHHNY